MLAACNIGQDSQVSNFVLVINQGHERLYWTFASVLHCLACFHVNMWNHLLFAIALEAQNMELRLEPINSSTESGHWIALQDRCFDFCRSACQSHVILRKVRHLVPFMSLIPFMHVNHANDVIAETGFKSNRTEHSKCP